MCRYTSERYISASWALGQGSACPEADSDSDALPDAILDNVVDLGRQVRRLG